MKAKFEITEAELLKLVAEHVTKKFGRFEGLKTEVEITHTSGQGSLTPDAFSAHVIIDFPEPDTAMPTGPVKRQGFEREAR